MKPYHHNGLYVAEYLDSDGELTMEIDDFPTFLTEDEALKLIAHIQKVFLQSKEDINNEN